MYMGICLANVQAIQGPRPTQGRYLLKDVVVCAVRLRRKKSTYYEIVEGGI